ncbi:hypothetical protein FGO68_gene11642 [Halteria grandinella]|uniref:Uncharacterized protein n=1 Tax=Halteria grandinella TaxID=5974 RepID=A0A8J8SV22_HALGN|nr:hypothetical protein FGO68_gene11642 [Halteria grandinella]
MEDLEYFFNDRLDFLHKIKTNTLSYQRLFYMACDSLVPKPNRDYLDNNDIFEEEINVQRQMNIDQETSSNQRQLPPELTRKLYQLVCMLVNCISSVVLKQKIRSYLSDN